MSVIVSLNSHLTILVSGEVSSGPSAGVHHRQGEEACCAAGGKDAEEAKDLHQFLQNLAQGQVVISLSIVKFNYCHSVETCDT